ncbi:MAG TPA: MFS transporter [Candidatus Acidoferrum sp.]|nr:MFS transporter [Candidatus Acidoferrum sp.]
MLIGGVAVGLLAGFLVGGDLANLITNTRRLRWLPVLVVGAIVRFGTEATLNAGVGPVEAIRLPLFSFAFGLLLVGCWANRREPGFVIAMVGIAANLVPIVLNGGYMPIWSPSLAAAGFTPADVHSAFHTIIGPNLDASFLLHGGPLGDVIPVPIPVIQNVASVGDLFLAGGLAFFAFAAVVRSVGSGAEDDEERIFGREHGPLAGLAGSARLPRTMDAAMRGQGVRAETGLTAGLAEASGLQRALVLGGSGSGLASPALALLPREFDALDAERTVALPGAAIRTRARQHPYVRLALNGSFSAMWVGQLISLFGDRIHQIALAFLVFRATDSALAVALVYLAASLPNLVLGPIAGTFVDRWDHKEVMVVSDLLRAALVMLVPIAAVTNLALVYPLIFLVTAASLFFRPARTAVIPRIVADDELLTANSATWLGDTLADIVGYPIAGLFVGFLGSALPLAFWIDAGTYIASAALIGAMAVPPMRTRASRALDDGSAGQRGAVFIAEMREGWNFLRHETVLLANTLQGVVGQFTLGVLLAITPVYAATAISRGNVSGEAAYAFLETAIGVGNLIGGFIIGLVGARLAKGRMVIIGYTAWGLCVAGLAVAGQLQIAIGLMIGTGIANMIFIIPSQTLFQERTPPELIGRVVGFRFSLVFGSMTIAMAVAGLLSVVIGPAAVIGIFGLTSAAAGLAGLLVPAVRDA